MNKEERLELENELLMTCSKAQAINKYIDELEENMILTKQWYKSQQENKQLKSILVELEEWLKDVDIFQMNFIENKNHITPFKAVLDKIQELKEKYK